MCVGATMNAAHGGSALSEGPEPLGAQTIGLERKNSE
jgi:hypothetical protein